MCRGGAGLPDYSRTALIASELGDVRQRGIHRIDQVPVVQTPTLIQTAETILGDQNVGDRRINITKTIRLAAAEVDSDTEEHISLLFGVTDELTNSGTIYPDAEPADLLTNSRSRMMTNLFDALGRPRRNEHRTTESAERSARRAEERIRNQLARKLIELADLKQRPAMEEPDAQSAHPHIHRLAQERQIQNALSQKPTVLWVHGEPGAGKSVVINASMQRQTRPIHRIDARDERAFEFGLAATLAKLGRSTNQHFAVLINDFVDLLNNSKYRALFLIQNFDPTQGLLPLTEILTSHCTVIIESRFPPPTNSDNMNVVYIPDLTMEEAKRIASKSLPRSSDESIENLCTHLRCRAILVDQASRSIARNHTDVGRYISETQNWANYLRAMQSIPEVDTVVVAHFSYIVEQVARSQNDLRLLTLLVHLMPTVSRTVLGSFWIESNPLAENSDAPVEPPLDSIQNLYMQPEERRIAFAAVPTSTLPTVLADELHNSLESLRSLGICNTFDDMVEMHPLSREIVRARIKDREIAISVGILRATAARAKKWGWRAAQVLPSEVESMAIQSISALNDVVSELLYRDRNAMDYDELQFCCAILARYENQHTQKSTLLKFYVLVLRLDPRKLVDYVFLMSPVREKDFQGGGFEYEQGESWESIATARAKSDSVEGCTALTIEMMILYGRMRPKFNNNGVEYSRDLRFEMVGMRIPVLADRCARHIAHDFPIHRWTTEKSLADRSQILQRMLDGEFKRQDIIGVYQNDLLIYGRDLISRGDLTAGIQVLLTNARGVAILGASPESTAVAISSFRLAVDAELRRKQIDKADKLYQELVESLIRRTTTAHVPRERFDITDAALYGWVALTKRDLVLSKIFLANADALNWDEVTDGNTLTLLSEVASELAGEIERFSANQFEELRLALMEQFARITTLVLLIEFSTDTPDYINLDSFISLNGELFEMQRKIAEYKDRDAIAYLSLAGILSSWLLLASGMDFSEVLDDETCTTLGLTSESFGQLQSALESVELSTLCNFATSLAEHTFLGGENLHYRARAATLSALIARSANLYPQNIIQSLDSSARAACEKVDRQDYLRLLDSPVSTLMQYSVLLLK